MKFKPHTLLTCATNAACLDLCVILPFIFSKLEHIVIKVKYFMFFYHALY
jgi:hypothetical protein